MNDRYICIHGHFYQPPRENPWLEDIEPQDSAAPYHDWNERITLECYAPNTASRILDHEGRIDEIFDNYAHISFNFGPTLLSWMERRARDVYDKIVAADKRSVLERNGHGNALAQVYNHVIMPLASRRDKVTQAVWGFRDFQKRFGRAPEGMWLAETAVDGETLEVLAELGVKFTILSPAQARRARPIGAERWEDVSGARVDPSRPYRWTSPNGLTLDLFFYDGPISRAVAFEGLLNNGEYFAGRLMAGFADHREGPQLVNVATDGESYGHHHRFGDMALAYALRKIKREGRVKLTNYGEFLAMHPPTWEAEIWDNSSWSCSHGVDRWRADCGCRIGAGPGWHQRWRQPLREALDGLRDALDELYEARAGELLKDPWKARNDYVDVLFDRSPDSLWRFFEAHGKRSLSPAETTEAMNLLEIQRHRMFMYTSCGWFFDEVSGLESVIIQLAAARAIQLAQGFPGAEDLERDFMEGLARAESNVAAFGDGREVYRRLVKPLVTDLPRVAAHLAIRSRYGGLPEAGRSYCYDYSLFDRRAESAGAASLSVGRARVTSSVTRESADIAYALLHLGGHDFRGALKVWPDGASFREAADAAFEAFRKGPPAAAAAEMERRFAGRTFSLQDLFQEDRRATLQAVIRDILGRYDGVYRQIVDENRPLMDYAAEAAFPMPEAFLLALRYVLDQDLAALVETLEGNEREGDRLERIRAEAAKFQIGLDFGPLAEKIRKRVEAEARAAAERNDPAAARRAANLVEAAERLDLKVILWRAENVFYDFWNGPLREAAAARRADPAFAALAERFRFKTPERNPVAAQ